MKLKGIEESQDSLVELMQKIPSRTAKQVRKLIAETYGGEEGHLGEVLIRRLA